MNQVVIGLGSNICAGENLARALELVGRELEVTAQAGPLTTSPIGFTDQPDFLNAAVLAVTDKELSEVKGLLKAIEAALGRVRTGNRNGPRTIDLDILIWNRELIDPEVTTRWFLKVFVDELLPDFFQNE